MKKLLISGLIINIILFGALTASAQKNGTEKWTFQTQGIIASSPAIGVDGTIYVGSGTGDRKLHAINPDGTEKWYFLTGSDVDSSPAIGEDGTIYVGSYDDYIYAINPDGTEKWRFYVTHYDQSDPAIAADGTIYVGSGTTATLFAINPNGSMKWAFPVGGSIINSSPVVGQDGTIYVGTNDQNLWAINPNGTIKWTFFIGGTTKSPAIGTDGTIFVGSTNGNLYAIYPDGTPNWIFPIGASVGSPVIGPDGTIYVGAGVTLYAINPDSSPKWTFSTGNICNSSPALSADGTIYVRSSNNLIAINPDSSPKWTFISRGSLCLSSPAIGEDGTIYVGSYDYILYAVKDRNGGLADSQWPMFHHDLGHSGRAHSYNYGFDFPLGKPDGDGYYVALDFAEQWYYGEKCGWVYHPGEDWNSTECADCDKDDPIWAVSDGVVEYAEWSGENWGYVILIRHDAPIGQSFSLPEGDSASTVWSQYGHLSSISVNPKTGQPWQKGDKLFQGEEIGAVGDYPSGSGTNYHLHFEIRKKKLRATIFPCKKSLNWVTARYTDPSDFINLNRD